MKLHGLHTILFSLLTMVCISVHAAELKPFTSDGCSAFPDGTIHDSDKWLNCCTAHDKAYWLGGTYEERLKADNDLKTCIASVGDEKLAKLMWAGVRVGGSPYWLSSFRWSYGWPYTRGYDPVTAEEKTLAESLLAQHGKQGLPNPPAIDAP